VEGVGVSRERAGGVEGSGIKEGGKLRRKILLVQIEIG
jgi:hypothetical protein